MNFDIESYREFFEKIERDYRVRIKMFPGYLDFEQRNFDYREVCERL